MLEDRQSQERQRVEDLIYDDLIKAAKIEIGPKLLARELEQVWEMQKQQIEKQGMEADGYLQHLGMDVETFKEKQLKDIATRRVQAQLILGQLQEEMKDDIKVSDKEVEKETKKMFEKYADNSEFMEKVNSMYKTGETQFEELRSRLQYKKITDSFIKKEEKKK